MAPPPPKKHTGRNVLIILGVVTLLMIVGIVSCTSMINSAIENAPTSGVVAGSEEPEPTTSGSTKPKAEAKPYTIKAEECKRGDYGQVELKVKITNHTKQKRTYLFDIAVEDPNGDVVGSGFGTVSNVRGGKSGTNDAFVSLEDDYDGKIKCIIEVTSYSEAN
jgi:hypothetical protein